MDQGYLQFHGIDCIYTLLENTIIILPKSKSDLKEVRKYEKKNDYLLEFVNHSRESFSAHVVGSFWTGHTLRLEIDHVSRLIPNKGIDGFNIVGDDIDLFFSPSRYYYKLHTSGKSIPKDLIYSKQIADKYNFSLNGSEVSIVLSYGNILSKGIGSDLKLHPKLEVNFEKTNDLSFVYSVYLVLVRFIQLVRHQTDYNLKPIELYGTIDGRKSYLGNMFIKPYVLRHINRYSNIESECYKPYISNLMQLVANDQVMVFKHFPQDENSSYDYDVFRFMSIFAAFEYECHANSHLYENACDDNIKEIRETTLSAINGLIRKDLLDPERRFIKQVKERVSQLGTQFGQATKIENAYSVLAYALKNSLNYLLWRTRREDSAEEIRSAAAALSKLRGTVIHGQLHINFSETELQYIRLLDVITYAQMLKRAGIPDEGIELIIGVVFNCNFLYMEETLRNN